MAFALRLKDSLHLRTNQVPLELANGEPLGAVLTRDLVAVEAAADTDMLTSILLLDGTRLRHGAAPNLPPAYCEAIDGGEIGPAAGSCGTAAFLRRPIYVTDIAQDRLWADYRELALSHALRACWSTPIFDDDLAVIGTFAIYHLTPRSPTAAEVSAIRMITDHVARAIIWSSRGVGAVPQNSASAPVLAAVTDLPAQKLGAPVQSDRIADIEAEQFSSQELLQDVAAKFEAIGRSIELVIGTLEADEPDCIDFEGLRPARSAALRRASAIRRALKGMGSQG
jgi:hypothetical protein